MLKISKRYGVKRMRYKRMLLCTMAIAVCLLAQIAFGQEDYLGGGYVGSSDRWKTMEPGIAGMVRWLDMPVTSYPWYSSDVSFYRQAVPGTTFTPFREYYAVIGEPIVGGIVSNPVKLNIAQETPYSVFYGAGQGLPYPQYASLMPTKANDLWFQGVINWTQYLACPVGTTLQLVARVPVGGIGGFYEIVQNNTTSLNYRTYQFFQGYNSMDYAANQIGRHMLYFVVNNQPSNVVIADVFAEESSTEPQTYTETSIPPAGYMPPASYMLPPTSMQPQAAASGGDTPVSIRSEGMRGYQVFLDGYLIGTEGTGGDVPDGIFDFQVVGGTSHNIRVYDGQFNYPKSMYFEKGVLKIIYVEPGAALYI
jgi:hypothetical protein